MSSSQYSRPPLQDLCDKLMQVFSFAESPSLRTRTIYPRSGFKPEASCESSPRCVHSSYCAG